MENASKALIMAAGLLIGVIILGLFIYEFYEMSKTGAVYRQRMMEDRNAEFNSQIVKYRDKNLSATDVASLVNYIHSFNDQNPEKINLKYGGYDFVFTQGQRNLQNFINGSIEADDFIAGQEQYNETCANARYKIDHYKILDIVTGNYDSDGRIKEISIKVFGRR